MMRTGWIHTMLGVMLTGAGVLVVSGCAATDTAKASATAGSSTVLIFDDEIALPTQAEAEEVAAERITRDNSDEEFERLVSEIDGEYYDG